MATGSSITHSVSGDASLTMAERFGARVETRVGNGTALCLVIGNASPLRAIASVEGMPVSGLGNGRVLALVELSRLPMLRQDPSIRHAGPVNVDRERLAAFAAMTGNPMSPQSGTA